MHDLVDEPQIRIRLWWLDALEGRQMVFWKGVLGRQFVPAAQHSSITHRIWCELAPMEYFTDRISLHTDAVGIYCQHTVHSCIDVDNSTLL